MQIVRKWKVQSQKVHRDFHDSLTGIPSSREKHLENFFTILTLSVLVACPSNLFQSQKMHVLRFKDSFLKLFQFFPRLFMTIHCLPHFFLNWNSSKHSMSPSTNSIFALFHLQIFKKKVWVLISSPHISCFELHFR